MSNSLIDEATVMFKPMPPIFTMRKGEPATATLYYAHYERLEALRRAAETGNNYLLKLALADYRKYGMTAEGANS